MILHLAGIIVVRICRQVHILQSVPSLVHLIVVVFILRLVVVVVLLSMLHFLISSHVLVIAIFLNMMVLILGNKC
ncbi:hypothetical protein CPB84DRAFT_1778195 [Gymnopilus junonius]|uniref:Uncharacterized protein n=1 Tax=Gymnopilus junonius TaxID=109634 RepID=A0A9P5NN70_GYMJU|nr:hypothetical protein CPB84DRAFT_1778195 [Gymnopilus junonius]